MSSPAVGNLASLQSALAQVDNAASAFGSNLGAASNDPAAFPQALMSAIDSLDSAAGALDMAASGGLGASPSSQVTSGMSSTYGTSGAYGAMSTGSPGGGSGAPNGAGVVSDALRYLGVPYRWGGTSPVTGFDCSGFVQHVFADLGVSLPRTSQQQAQVGTPVASLAQAVPGDLLFFEPGPGGPGHVGIYVGNGMMIDAPHTGTTVQVQPVWTSQLAGIRQVVPAGPAASSAGSTADAGSTAGATAGASYASGAGWAVPASGSSAAAPGAVPAAYAPLFLQAGARYGLPPQLLAAVAQVESGFNPNAVSPAGAEGLMQIMPATAAAHGVDPFNPAQAVDGAARILSSDLRHFGSLPLALAAYNAGAGAVEQYGGIPPYPQTQNYVQKVLGAMESLGGAVPSATPAASSGLVTRSAS